MTLNPIQFLQDAHYYLYPSGEPFYEVPLKTKEGMRSPTIKDAREAGAVPSVTTILRVLAKPGLEIWKQNQVLLSALTHPLRDQVPVEEFVKIIAEEVKREGELAAQKGSQIHQWIEEFLGKKPTPSFGVDFDSFIHFAEVNQMKAQQLEHCFANKDFGGRIDFLGEFQGKCSIIDFKTQNTRGKEIRFYEDWALQLSAYRYGCDDLVFDPVEQIVSVVVVSDNFERIAFKIWKKPHRYYDIFESILKIWQFQNHWKEEYQWEKRSTSKPNDSKNP